MNMQADPGAEADLHANFARDTQRDFYIPGSILLDPPDPNQFAQTTCDVIAVFFATLIVCATAASIGVAAFLIFFVRW
jgi:hypothetical protein